MIQSDNEPADSLISFRFRRAIVPVLQSESSECALACLAMTASYYGRYTELAELRRDYPTSLKGINLAQLMDISRRLELSARAVRVDIDSLSRLKLPCILHWDMDHFVVLSGVSNGQLTIFDPAIGKRRVTSAQASRSFTGVALELWPSSKFKRRGTADNTQLRIRDLLGRTVGLVPLLLQILALAVGIEVLSLILPLMTQWIIDYVIVAHDEDLLTTCALGFGLIVIVHQALTAMRQWVVMYMGTTLNVQWQANVFAHMVRLPIDFFQKRHLGDILSRFGSIEQIQNTISTSFITAVLDGIMSSATLVLMLVYSAKLSLVVVIAGVLYMILRVATFAPLRGSTLQKIIFAAKQQTSFLETLRGIKAIKLFLREDLRRLNWLSLFVQQTNAGLQTQRAQLLFQTAHGLLFGIERIVVLWLGASMIMDGHFTVGMLMAFMSFREQFGGRIASLTDKYFEFRMLGLQSSRLADIVLTPPEPEHHRVAITQTPQIAGKLELEGVRFRYSMNEPMVLKGVTMTVSPGETVAITGESGCGKTTIVNLMLGILRPTRGSVKLDGIDIEHLGLRALRQTVSAVTQDDTLFAGTIADNICFFADHPDIEQIERCARIAAIHDEIFAMPMGYRTRVGDMGSILSGGQKQRVLLARALYNKPKILILDEASSHLDLVREAQIDAALRALNLTRIIVAHRPETIANVDRVLSVAGGHTRLRQRQRRKNASPFDVRSFAAVSDEDGAVPDSGSGDGDADD